MVSLERLDDLNDAYEVALGLQGVSLVFVSAVWVKELDDPRLQAVEESLRVTMASSGSVTHMVVLDDRSHPEVERRLRATGALVVVINGDTEGGLARPYVIGFQLIKEFGLSGAHVVKVEGEKPIGTEDNIAALRGALRYRSVVVGVRSEETWASMPPYQAMTERQLGPAIAEQLGVPSDTPSGVLALSAAGIDIFLQCEWKKWEYLFGVPLIAKLVGLSVGAVELTWLYSDFVRGQETGDPFFDNKRLEQIDAMLDEAERMANEAGLPPSALVAELREQRKVWGEELQSNA